MLVWRDCEQAAREAEPSVIAIGTFDGVHLGHRALLAHLVGLGRATGARPTIVTFDPHPLAVIRPELAPPMLATLAYRLELFAEAGVQAVLALPFTRELAAEPAEAFVRRVLVGALAAKAVSVGENFRFGNRAAGDVALLEKLGSELGFACQPLPLVSPQPGKPWSSTAIRGLLADGDVAGAAAGLGRAHRVTGVVGHGDHRGRELGFPTANLSLPPQMAVPGDGVYAAWLRVEGCSGPDAAWLPAAVSVGSNPTFDGVSHRVEAYVLGRTGLELYGETVSLDFVSRLRPMARFDGVAELVAQMSADVEQAKLILGV